MEHSNLPRCASGSRRMEWSLIGSLIRDGAGNRGVPNIPGLEFALNSADVLLSEYMYSHRTTNFTRDVDGLPYEVFISRMKAGACKDTLRENQSTYSFDDLLPGIKGLAANFLWLSPGDELEITLYTSEYDTVNTIEQVGIKAEGSCWNPKQETTLLPETQSAWQAIMEGVYTRTF